MTKIRTIPTFWWLARGTALVGLGALAAALALQRQDVLDFFWKTVIPILPASFLLAPMLWRNVCPLATMNHWTGDRRDRATPSPAAATALQWSGIALLFVLVPFRHVVLNTMPLGMLALIAVIGVLTLAAGSVWPVRAGFCNGLCPVRPVETLYGQRPLAVVPRARCEDCTLCVKSGCLDLWGAKTAQHLLGPQRRSMRWMLEPFGFFTIAFPGLVLAYFLTKDTTSWPTVYGFVLGLAATSATLLGALIATLRIPSRIATPALAAVAFGLYYWFAAPGFGEAVHLPGGPWPVRAVAGLLLIVWILPRRIQGSENGILNSPSRSPAL